jgi:hypothetical protein
MFWLKAVQACVYAACTAFVKNIKSRERPKFLKIHISNDTVAKNAKGCCE